MNLKEIPQLNWFRWFCGDRIKLFIKFTRFSKIQPIHSMTVKLLNWHYCSNTTNASYWGLMGLVREKIYLYDVKISTCLVDANEDYNCFGKLQVAFSSCWRFQNDMESRDWLSCKIKEDCVLKSHVRWVPVTTAWRVFGLRMEERPPAMEVSCKYIE
jgi:hypothetical protein